MIEAVLSAVRVVSEFGGSYQGKRRIEDTYYPFQPGAPVQLAPQLENLSSDVYVQGVMCSMYEIITVRCSRNCEERGRVSISILIFSQDLNDDIKQTYFPPLTLLSPKLLPTIPVQVHVFPRAV